MGETDEKENVPAATPTAEIEEPKETEKLLNADNVKNEKTEVAVDVGSPTVIENGDSTSVAEQKPATEEEKKTNGDEIIDIPEVAEKKPKEDGREVKPKKIPIGGIKMPGFFTRSKPKAENDGAEGELLENAGNEAKAEEAAAKEGEEETAPRPNLLATLKAWNPFAKKTAAETDENADEKTGECRRFTRYTFVRSRVKSFFPFHTEPAEGDAEKVAEKQPANDAETDAENPPPKKGLLNAIRLPIANIIPKRLRSGNQQSDDVELGNGPHNKAGLASMETLDDSIKDTDNKDVTDKAPAIQDEALETVKLNESEAKEKEANEKVGETPVEKLPIIERIRAYRCSVDDLAIIGGILVFLLLVAIICAFSFTGNPAPINAPLRDGKFIEAITSCGKVEGVLEDSAFAFRGIPYAVPPTGENRWKPAKLIESIDSCWNGTLKAHNSSSTCWQIYANGSVAGEENCLNLDVISPHIRYDNPLPVVVLISSESLTGDSPSKLRPSAKFARERDVIFVRPNFRLGIFGFLALETISKSTHPPSSGNYGFTDIVAALQWVQLNIVHFGGNPKEVTLVGHRAGATLVSALVTSPLAKGLFARAWVSSGAASFPGRPLIESERNNIDYLQHAKCSDVDCLRRADAKYLNEVVPDTWRRVYPELPGINENTTARHEWLVLDGQVLRKHPNDLWNAKDQPQLVIGTTAHESHSEKLLLKYKEWTPELVRREIESSKLGQLGLTDEILQRYNATYKGLVSIVSDIRTVCPLLTIARVQPYVPFYVVTQTAGDLDIASVDDDIQAILGRYEPRTPAQRRYISAIQQLFYHYVSHGELNQHDPRRRVLNIAQDALSTENYPNCDFWISKDIVPRYARLD